MRRIVACLLVMIVATAAVAEDWPGFWGPNTDGMAPDQNINKNWGRKPPKTLWTIRMSDQGYAGPSVVDGVMYIIDYQNGNNVVRALDLKTGKDKWSYTFPDKRVNYGAARSTPVYDDGRLYVIGQTGQVHCIDTGKKGQKIWSTNILKSFRGKTPKWYFAMSPFIDGKKLVLVPGGRAGVVTLDKMTGKVLARGSLNDVPGYATPVKATLDGKQQYIISMGTKICGVDPDTLKTLWSYDWENRFQVNAAMPLVYDGDKVFLTSGYRTGCVMIEIDGDKVREVWRNKAMSAHFSSPILYKGHIYGTSDPGLMLCIDPKNGRTLWKQRGFEKGGLVGVDGVAIALDGRGGDLMMVELTPKRYNELGRISKPLGGQSWTAPIVADGKLLIRNKTALRCMDMK